MTTHKVTRDPDCTVNVHGKPCEGKIVIRVDGLNFVVVAIGFMAVLLPPVGEKLALAWGNEQEVDGLGWKGGVVRGGELEVLIRGARIH